MRARSALVCVLAVSVPVLPSVAHAADPEAGKRMAVCHKCGAALPYTGRIGVENLPKFLANPRRFKPSTAMNFTGLRNKKDIDDVIAYIAGAH